MKGMSFIVAKMFRFTHIQSVKCRCNNYLASSQSLEYLSLQEKCSLWWKRVAVAMWVMEVQAMTDNAHG